MPEFLVALVGGGLLVIVLVFLLSGRYREDADRRMRHLRTRVISLEIQRDRVAEELERAKALLAEREADSYSYEIERERADSAVREAQRLSQELERMRGQLSEQASERLTQELEQTRAELAERERQLARRELVVVIDHSRVNSLQAIKGIGPKLAEVFVAEGVENLADLADMTDEDLDKLAVQWPALASRIRREGWRAQAARLVEQGLEPDQLADDAGSGAPQDIPVEIEEPELPTPPQVEYPKVVMG